MDFFDDQYSGSLDGGSLAPDRVNNALPHIDGAVSQTIARAIRDATQTADRARQHEAASWLRICCPDIAEQVDLPDLHLDTMATLAAAYVVTAQEPADAHPRFIFG